MGSESRSVPNKTPYKVDVEPIPMDTLTVYGTGKKECWYRVPSWRVHFDHEPLKPYDIRLHRSVDSNAVWVLSEASTGFQFFSDIPHEHYMGDEGAMLAEFAAGMMLKMTPEKLASGIAKAKERLRNLPPNPMNTGTPSETGTPQQQILDAAFSLIRECVEGTVEDCTKWNRRARAFLATYAPSKEGA